jgi:hypothetical protein
MTSGAHTLCMMMGWQRKDWGEACIDHVETECRMEGNPESAGANAMETDRVKSKSATAGYGEGTAYHWSRPLANVLVPPDLQSWSF